MQYGPSVDETPSTPEEPSLASRAFDRQWDIDFHISFTFEVPLGGVLGALPAGVVPVEPVPEIALLNVIHARYGGGTLGERDPFDEVVCSVVVQPDLALDMPTPRQTLCVLDVLSNSETFVRTKIPSLRMPVRFEPTLRATIDEDRLGTEVSDADGPIFALRCGEDQPRYKDRAFCGQYFARCDDALFHGVWRWWGSIHETQRHRRGGGALRIHPLFTRLELPVHAARDCYLQQVSRPQAQVHMKTYAPAQLD